jgi:hypothetical protein
MFSWWLWFWSNGLWASPQPCTTSSCWFSSVAVKLPAAHSVTWLSCLWAACLWVSHSFGLIHSSLSCDVVVAYVLVHMCVVPRFKEQMLYLVH